MEEEPHRHCEDRLQRRLTGQLCREEEEDTRLCELETVVLRARRWLAEWKAPRRLFLQILDEPLGAKRPQRVVETAGHVELLDGQRSRDENEHRSSRFENCKMLPEQNMKHDRQRGGIGELDAPRISDARLSRNETQAVSADPAKPKGLKAS